MREYKSLLCNLYIIGLTVILPLYMPNGWWKLGDDKYILFRNLTGICLLIWLTVKITGMISGREKVRSFHRLDRSMLYYGVAVIASALFSAYSDIAWWGFGEWYMGAVSQLLFIGIYFFVSDCYEGVKYPVYFWMIAVCCVILSGICNRLGLDPLRVMDGYEITDWEYSHMIASIGNINWFSGYLGMAILPLVSLFLYGSNKALRVWCFLGSCAGCFLLGIQGSDMGIALSGMLFLTLLIWGCVYTEFLWKAFLLPMGTFFCLTFYQILITVIGRDALYSIPIDGGYQNIILWKGWCLFAGISLGMVILAKKGVLLRYRKWILGVLGCILLGMLFCFLAYREELVDWFRARGNGRFQLWELSVRGFLRGNVLQKLIGQGPDCYAPFIYESFSPDELIQPEDRWQNAIFANAHNEWFNCLVNLGILGVAVYLNLFVAAWNQYKKYLFVLLAIVIYFMSSLVGFQQCLNTPYLFLILGLCDGERKKQVRFITDQEKKG